METKASSRLTGRM